MDTFHVVMTVLSMVLGLSVTRQLLGLVTVFRIRRQPRTDWVPLIWSLSLLLTQLEYWWALNGLPLTRPDYSFIDFVCLVTLTLMLFLAAALLLPSRPEDEGMGLRAYFESEGRFALLAMAAFTGLAFLANLFFFGAPLLSLWALLDIPLLALLVLGFFARSRMAQTVVAGAYLPLLLIDIWISLGT
jgi:hypothetical protein